ncbi:MAG: phosphoglycerate kinase [Flavobacteriaceae bacterium]|jgi:phosphoglycerate kinase
MKHIKELQNLKGKKVLVRADFNVPLGGDGVVDEHEAFRIKKGTQTIEFLRDSGAQIIILSHIGRDPEESLSPIATYLQKTDFPNLRFIPETLPTEIAMNDGDIVMLENLRSDEREVLGDVAFAEELSRYADIYVNDAFAVSHRKHASIVGIPQYLPSYVGFQLALEIEELHKVYVAEAHPFLFILGGAKIETKLPLIESYLSKADTVFVAGALMNTLFYSRGDEVGVSVFDDGDYDLENVMKSDSLMLPFDVTIEKDTQSSEIELSDMASDMKIVDIGSGSLKALSEKIKEAGLIVWNGPIGWYEGGYDHMTNAILDMLIQSNAKTVIGGGDTVSLVQKKNVEDRLTFVSTGGGAMLEYLHKGTLPGIEALG